MTDVDRLRAAADRLDTYADDFHSREFAHRASQDRVTAALLRAVAAVAVRPDETAEECYVWDRAGDLADVILGDTDE